MSSANRPVPKELTLSPGSGLGIQGTIWGWWEGPRSLMGRGLSFLALPLELLFRLVVSLRNAAFRVGLLRERSAGIPVVCVGNLAVGGTGKTPVAGWVVERLSESGARPALVSRGYGPDELELHRRWNPGVPVASGRRRREAVRAVAEVGAGLAVLDDGFQHRALKRDLDLVLLAAEHPLPARLLPRGPYREPLGALRRADLTIITRRTASTEDADRLEAEILSAAPSTTVVRVRLVPRDWTDLEGSPTRPPEGELLAVASVARPVDFHQMVREETQAPTELVALPDHHEYTPGDVDRIVDRARGRVIVTTEKDAVKLARFRDRFDTVRVLRLRVTIERGEEELLGALESLQGRGR